MVDDRKVPEGYKVTEVGVIPEDWDVFKLGDIIDYTKGFAFKSSDYRKSGVRIIRVSDTDYDQIKDIDEVYIDKSLSQKFNKWKLTEDDIVLSTVGSKPPMYDSMVGKAIKVSLRHEGALLNQNAVKISSKNYSLANQMLIFYNLKTKRYLTNIEKIFRGNANQASITLLDLFKFEITMPKCGKEQKAIAEALSDTDSLIQSVEKLIEKKKKIKQGAMQQLLTGKKRLPGFSGEWDSKGFSDVFVKKSTKNFQIASNEYLVSGHYPVVDQGKKKIVAFYDKQEKVFNVDIDGVIIFGDHTRLFKYIDFDFVIGADGTQILTVNSNNDTKFQYYQLVSKEIPNTGYNRHFKYLKEFVYFVPPIEEQKAIAKVLSDMDAEIEGLEEKLEKYKTIKQGMMQELLTGRIRLI